MFGKLYTLFAIKPLFLVSVAIFIVGNIVTTFIVSSTIFIIRRGIARFRFGGITVGLLGYFYLIGPSAETSPIWRP